MTDDQAALESFQGVARLFPLPNLVLFPNVDQGLHIFEYRYRQMAADALDTDQLIALVLLKPDWDEDYDGAPPIETVACLGRIVQHEEMEDGRYNLHVRGLARFVIESEIDGDGKDYRQASGTLLLPVVPSDTQLLMTLRQKLREVVLARFDPDGLAYVQLSTLFSSDSTLDELCDQLGYSLPLPITLKQEMLGEPDLVVRVELLTSALKPPTSTGRSFPPKFSSN